MAVTVDLIVNPASGPPSRQLARQARAAHAIRTLQAMGVHAVRVTETCGAGDGALAAARAVADNVPSVVVWGGDGTLNEVAAQLVGTQTVLGIVPGGSGNGLARALGLPLQVGAALCVAINGSPFLADVGVANDLPFFNIAGLGLDAGVAERFNASGGGRRGLATYLRCCTSEIRIHVPKHYRLRLDGQDWFDASAHLVAIANGQQYGHDARIAPHARLDDGCLDVVVVTDVTLIRLLRHGWRLFNGTFDRVPGVHTGHARSVDVEVPGGALLHLDGEMKAVAGSLSVTTQPRALRVRTNAGAAAARQPPA